MPRLVQLYIASIAIGFALALVFTGLLIGLDVAHLRHLILSSGAGMLAGLMLVLFNTIVFSGVQFGISVMRMAESKGPRGGSPARNPDAMRPAAALAPSQPRRR